MDPSLVHEIEQLRHMKAAALRARYRELFGEESRSSNRQFLFRRVIWRLQAKAEGDLSDRKYPSVELGDRVGFRTRTHS